MADSAGGAENKVLVAMDGSDHSYQAFQFYIKYVHKQDTELLVATCPDYKNLLKTPVMSMDSGMVAKMVKHTEDDVTKLTTQITGTLHEAKVKAKLLRLTGEPGSAIVKASRDYDVNLIVTGSRGLSTVRRTLIGSVSEYVLHHAHCPVMICRGDALDKHSKH